MIIIEDGTIVTGANSYITVQNYRDYWSALGVDTTDEVDAAIEGRLINAFITNNIQYRGLLKGKKVDPMQPGLFPRTGLVDEDGNSLSASVIPSNILYWQSEAAFILKTQDIFPTIERDGRVKRVKTAIFQAVETETEYTDKGALEQPVFKKLDILMHLFLNSSRIAWVEG